MRIYKIYGGKTGVCLQKFNAEDDANAIHEVHEFRRATGFAVERLARVNAGGKEVTIKFYPLEYGPGPNTKAGRR